MNGEQQGQAVPEAPAPMTDRPEPMSMMDRLERNFTYHPPNPHQTERYNLLRDTAKMLACLIVRKVPDSRERSLAITKLEEAVMWANAAIARNE